MKTLLFVWLSLSLFSCGWKEDLRREIKIIDDGFPGEIGVVIKDLRNGSIMEYNAAKKWYLSSTIKVMVAISLLEDVEKGKISLDQKITLKQKDFVDGTGTLIWSEPGQQFTVAEVLKAMLQESDNTAADILINLIGLEELNSDVKKWMPGSGKITSLLEVRYLSYGELHPKARTLSNMDFVLLKNLPLEKRHVAFAEKVKIPVKELNARDLEEAFEKYYKNDHNTGSLQAFVTLLEKLEEGKLLSKKNTSLIMHHMEHMKTGNHRLKAGLPSDFKFIQKTGTQIHRACNVGLIRISKKKSDYALAVCIEKPSETIDSDVIFKQLGTKFAEAFRKQEKPEINQ